MLDTNSVPMVEESDLEGPDVKYEIVAICGTAPSSRMLANEQGPEVEIWALNDCYTFLKNANRWFEIHAREVWQADGKEHIAFLKDFPNTVYMLQHWDDVPNSVRYPFESVRDKLFPDVDLSKPDDLKKLMLASSIDYMLALALVEGFKEIRLLGINMATQTEFNHQLPTCSYWLGRAQGMGVKVVLPPECPMLEVPIYGITRRDYIDKHVLATRKARVMAQKQKVEAELNAISGALQVIETLEATMDAPQLAEEDRESNSHYAQPVLNLGNAVGDVGMAGLNGAQGE